MINAVSHIMTDVGAFLSSDAPEVEKQFMLARKRRDGSPDMRTKEGRAYQKAFAAFNQVKLDEWAKCKRGA